MNFNKKLVNGLIALLAIVWIGNFIIYNQHVLKEPLTIKHFYNIRVGMESFDLYYIDNINSDNRISSIVFPELGEEYVNFYEYENNRDNRYYKMKTVNVNIPMGGPGNVQEKYKNKIITKAEITFNGGKKIVADIGKIYFYSNDIKESHFRSIRSSSSSDHTGNAALVTQKDVKVTGIDFKFPDLLDEGLKLTINNQKFSEVKFPIEVANGATVDIYHSFNFKKEDIRRNYAYRLTMDIFTKDSNGNMGCGAYYINYFLQSPDQYNIKELVKKESES